jgi:hypothetical protein
MLIAPTLYFTGKMSLSELFHPAENSCLYDTAYSRSVRSQSRDMPSLNDDPYTSLHRSRTTASVLFFFVFAIWITAIMMLLQQVCIIRCRVQSDASRRERLIRNCFKQVLLSMLLTLLLLLTSQGLLQSQVLTNEGLLKNQGRTSQEPASQKLVATQELKYQEPTPG